MGDEDIIIIGSRFSGDRSEKLKGGHGVCVLGLRDWSLGSVEVRLVIKNVEGGRSNL